MRKCRFMLVAILLLSVGYASVSTTLDLNGDVRIATNDADFDVKFTKVTSEAGTLATISDDGRTFTFRSSDLSTIGDSSILNFKITNNSEMYDAEVSVNCTLGGDTNDYYEITEKVKTPIVGKTAEWGNVQIKLQKAPIENFSDIFTCTLTVTAKERTTKAETLVPVKYIPKYFEFGDPTTSSTIDYTTLGRNVFVGLDADGVQKSVCFVRNGSLECFKNNNVEEELVHVKEVVSDTTCSDTGSYVICNSDDFICAVHFDGTVSCRDTVAPFTCDLFFGGNIHCY